MPTIYVVYRKAEHSVTADDAERALRAAGRGWTIERTGSVAIGLYDWAPVRVDLNTHTAVLEESSEMADGLEANGAADTLVATVRRADGRFEITWEFKDDPDPVPETAELMSDVARILVDLTGGVALLGHQPFRFGGFREACDQLI